MIYLVTGGSGSGKSAYAESLLSGFENIRSRYYIATMQVYGEEGKKRVERHRRLRAGKGFITSEQTVQIEQALKKFKAEIWLAGMEPTDYLLKMTGGAKSDSDDAK